MSSMVGLDVLYKIYSPDIFIIEACKGSNNYTETWSHATTHKFLPTGPQLLFFTLNDIFWLGAVLSWLSPISIYNCTTKHSLHSETLRETKSTLIFKYDFLLLSHNYVKIFLHFLKLLQCRLTSQSANKTQENHYFEWCPLGSALFPDWRAQSWAFLPSEQRPPCKQSAPVTLEVIHR